MARSAAYPSSAAKAAQPAETADGSVSGGAPTRCPVATCGNAAACTAELIRACQLEKIGAWLEEYPDQARAE